MFPKICIKSYKSSSIWFHKTTAGPAWEFVFGDSWERILVTPLAIGITSINPWCSLTPECQEVDLLYIGDPQNCHVETNPIFLQSFFIFEISRVPYLGNILLFSPWHFDFVCRGMLLNSLLDVNGSLDVDVDRECWSAKGGNHRMVGSWGCFHKFLELHVSMFQPVRIFNDSGGWWFIIRKSLTSYSFYIMSFCDR